MATTDMTTTSPGSARHKHATTGALRRCWPTAAGIAASGAALLAFFPLPHEAKIGLTGWSVLLAAVIYLAWGAARGELRDRRLLAAQTAGVLAFGALAVIAVTVAPGAARSLLAAGWLAHAGWDAVHHRLRRVVPRWYAEWCFVLDVVFAAALLGTGWL